VKVVFTPTVRFLLVKPFASLAADLMFSERDR